MKRFFLILFSAILLTSSLHSEERFDPDYKFQRSGNFVQDKNFYLLTIFQNSTLISGILKNDAELSEFRKNQFAEMKPIRENVLTGIDTVAGLFLYDSDDLKFMRRKMEYYWDNNDGFRNEIIKHLRPSGAFILFDSLSDREMFLAAWDQTIEGINYIIDVYALARKGRYPQIDSITFYYKDRVFQSAVDGLCSIMYDQMERYKLFFDASLHFGLELMDFNARDEAARFEPMEAGENKAAYEYIPSIGWDDYPYTVILVPGYGHEEPQLKIHPLGKIRCKFAADRYNKGMAPLIIVSGGYVHPFQTKHCEAIEMKRELMENYDIPEKAIIIEPHARHTTTNFRNAARLIYRYGIPADKKAISTTTKDQSYYIKDMNLDERCMRELEYVPYILFDRISRNDVEWMPQVEALHFDPWDPLDP